MTSLPIDSFLADIVATLRDQQAIVLVAEPGAGKTTRVPPAIVRAGLLPTDQPNLVMLQPRRIAARTAAQRIAAENNWTIGKEVGWHVRFDRQLTAHTRLRVVTEGILIRQLIDDPFLSGVGCVVLDEFHERSIHSDLSLALLHELMASGRDDLRIVVMSATLDAEPVARFLGGCPIIRVPGRTFPVSVEYAANATAAALENRVADAVDRCLAREGDVLVFLPGAREIEAAQRALSSHRSLDVLPLHGSLPFEQQQLALQPSRQKKVILATNIAETSLTIDGVTTVIDSGLARVASFDAQRGLDRLDLQRISKASAIQRAGRAGRTGPGHCLRLMTEKEFHALSDFDVPEILRIDLTPTVLQLYGWGDSNPAEFAWFESPAPTAIDRAERLLTMLGALDNKKLTDLGRSLLSFPLHPRLARLMIAGQMHDQVDAASMMATLLSEGVSDRGQPRVLKAESDVVGSMNSVELTPTLRRLAERFKQLAATQKPHRSAVTEISAETSWLRMLLLAFPDRVCRRRTSDPSAAVMVGGTGVRLAQESVVRHAEYFLALDARQIERAGKAETLVTVASRIESEWLEEFFRADVVRENVMSFDETDQRVIGTSVVRYHDLILSESRDTKLNPRMAGEVLAAALVSSADARLQADAEAANLLARLDLLRRKMPEHPWPQIDAADIVREWSVDKISVDQLLKSSPAALIAARLHYPLDRLLEEQAPISIKVPTGNLVRLQYAIGQQPVLAVRLQEVFGMTQTPRIAGGRVAVLLHLLGPNYRPVQITDDLASFWKTAYFQVRKDLRVRYPKHSWPDDPLNATPQARGGRRSR